MSLSHSLLTSGFFCEYCKKETRFLAIRHAIALTGRSKATMYRWMDRDWVHWRELPGRCGRLICLESLSRMHQADSLPLPVPPAAPALSKSAGSRQGA